MFKISSSAGTNHRVYYLNLNNYFIIADYQHYTYLTIQILSVVFAEESIMVFDHHHLEGKC